jgi:catechol 2,3-dioxygenase-like lactoylglutathione lyase family enzyme
MTPNVHISLMLAVQDAPAAVDWYKRALGATELWNLGGVAGLSIAAPRSCATIGIVVRGFARGGGRGDARLPPGRGADRAAHGSPHLILAARTTVFHDGFAAGRRLRRRRAADLRHPAAARVKGRWRGRRLTGPLNFRQKIFGVQAMMMALTPKIFSG